MVEIKFKKLEKEHYDKMFDWCREQFGREALWVSQLDIPNGVSTWHTSHSYAKAPNGMITGTGLPDVGNAKFNFRDDKSATLFSLRWSDIKGITN